MASECKVGTCRLCGRKFQSCNGNKTCNECIKKQKGK